MLRYDTCPICGGKKRSVSKTCQKCRYRLNDKPSQEPDQGINYELLTLEWLSEFRGFFWGEGSAAIIPNNRSYSALLTIGLRADDLPALQDIQRRLGGFLVWNASASRQNPNAGLGVHWRVSKMPHVRDICSLLLERVVMPAKKVKDVRQVFDFCEWRLPRYGCRLTDEERTEMKRRHTALLESRIFSC